MRYAIGVAGAHRTGKSTLCDRFHAMTGIPIVRTSSSAVFARLGFSPQAAYDLDTRLLIQAEILSELERQYKDAPPVFVTDRTPLDAAAYLLAEYSRNTLHQASDVRIMSYLDRCRLISRRYFGGYVILQPGIPIEHDESKAPAVPGYMEHINSIIVGLALTDYSQHADMHIVKREDLHISSRVLALSMMSGRMFDYMERNSCVAQSRPM